MFGSKGQSFRSSDVIASTAVVVVGAAVVVLDEGAVGGVVRVVDTPSDVADAVVEFAVLVGQNAMVAPTPTATNRSSTAPTM